MLNVAAVPILNITLRNNLLDVIPVKRWIRKANCCLCLLQDQKNSVKGAWSIILTIPVISIVLFYRDVSTLVTYTGGFCGAFILFFIPCTLVWFARRANPEALYGKNPNKSPFASNAWVYLCFVWGIIVIVSVIIKIASGETGE